MATYQRKALLDDLKENVIEVIVKNESLERTIRITHAPQLMPPNSNAKYLAEQHEVNAASGIIIAWAVDMHSWFRFYINEVTSAQAVEGYL